MRILMMHSRYQQRGGEDLCTLAETALLREGGHEVELVEYDNHQVVEIGKLRAGIRTIWSAPAVRDVRARLAGGEFDLLHVQNYLPLVSPAVLLAASRMGVPTVQALRNYRLTCANGLLFRDGSDCRRCLGSMVPWHGVRLGCYRDSRVQSGAIAAMIATHRLLGTWARHTDAFVATSEAVRRTYLEAHFPAERVHAKADIVYPGIRADMRERRALFVGRLTPEKGVAELIAAWKGRFDDAQLTIVGTGPYETQLIKAARGDSTITFRGERSHTEVMELMARSRVVMVPSTWEEPFGRIATEAFSVATPVIATAKGGLTDIVGGSGGGATYTPGDLTSLTGLIRRALDDQLWWDAASGVALRAFETTYSQPAILARTEEIYAAAIARRHSLAQRGVRR